MERRETRDEGGKGEEEKEGEGETEKGERGTFHYNIISILQKGQFLSRDATPRAVVHGRDVFDLHILWSCNDLHKKDI